MGEWTRNHRHRKSQIVNGRGAYTASGTITAAQLEAARVAGGDNYFELVAAQTGKFILPAHLRWRLDYTSPAFNGGSHLPVLGANDVAFSFMDSPNFNYEGSVFGSTSISLNQGTTLESGDGLALNWMFSDPTTQADGTVTSDLYWEVDYDLVEVPFTQF